MGKKYPALAKLPEALEKWRDIPQWVAFKPEERQGKLTKPPMDPHTGRYAKVDNPKTWGTYAEACAAVIKYNFEGIGILLVNGLFGIDIDHARDESGNIIPFAADIIGAMNSYTEISPSGDGFHILATGILPPVNTRKANKQIGRSKLEIYPHERNRYFTITGNTLTDTPVNERTQQAAQICKKYLSVETNPDAEALEKYKNSKAGSRYTALYDRGDISAYNGDHSAATQALVNDLCYWTNGDPAAIDRLFRRSALFESMRDEKGVKKWDRIHSQGLTYGQMTINTAMASFTPYTPKTSTENSIPQPQEEKTRSLDIYWASDLDREDITPPQFIIPDILPTGLTIFAAPPKTGKSFFMLEAAAAIADGGLFWGKQTKAGTVLYLDIESSKYRVKKRLAAMGIQCPKKLGIAHRSEQLDTGLLDQLQSHMEKYPDTVAIIIDTLGRVKGSGRSRADAYTQDTQILSPLQTFALQNNIAVIAVTHLRKDMGYKPEADPFELITGSNAQFGVSDAGWLIMGKRGEKEKHFIAAGRDIEQEIDWTIERLDNGRWMLKGETAKLNLEAEYNDYIFAPVTSTIRELVSVPGSSWSGTAMALSEQIIKHTGTSILPADIGMTVKKMAPLLLKYDNILHIPPNPNGGNKGRVHTFRREETL